MYQLKNQYKFNINSKCTMQPAIVYDLNYKQSRQVYFKMDYLFNGSSNAVPVPKAAPAKTSDG
ncbi:hypothetical protein GCM10007352_00900 [Mucilaginibacter phyllosphaerae]|nr:hypothetical protein GCM10007352_00900 [Mucilaginibacter phyllosphaerae]